jgi:cytochrome b6-f complex iron-sulfur subunit
MTTQQRLQSEESRQKGGVTRRRFLGWAWAGSTAALLGSSVFALYRFMKPLLEGAFGGKINIGSASQFSEPGSITHVSDARTYISNVDGDGLLPMWQRCTHLGCTVPWVEEEEQFHCPCHGSLYDKKGEVTGGPAPRPMDLFPMEYSSDGELIVDTGTVIERSAYEPVQLTKV